LIGLILKRLWGVELVVEVHGDWIEAPSLYKKWRGNKLVKSLMVALGKLSLRAADRVRTISGATTRLAKRFSGDKPYYTFPTFTDLEFFLDRGNAEVGRTVLFVGYLNEVKGVEYLIRAFRKIQNKGDDCRLVIAGNGRIKKDLEDLVRELEMIGQVVFAGELEREKLAEELEKCRLLVLPSLSEGLGRVLLEAMAVGKPVVASRVGGIPDIVAEGENGFLCPPRDIDCLAGKIQILLSDPGLAEDLGRRGRNFVREKFSTTKYLADYTRLINGRAD